MDMKPSLKAASDKPKQVFCTVMEAKTSSRYVTSGEALPVSVIEIILFLHLFNNSRIVQWDFGANIFAATTTSFYSVLVKYLMYSVLLWEMPLHQLEKSFTNISLNILRKQLIEPYDFKTTFFLVVFQFLFCFTGLTL